MKISRRKLETVLVRQQKGLSETGVTSHTLKRITEGKEIKVTTAGKIAAALGVDITELMED